VRSDRARARKKARNARARKARARVERRLIGGRRWGLRVLQPPKL